MENGPRDGRGKRQVGPVQNNLLREARAERKSPNAGVSADPEGRGRDTRPEKAWIEARRLLSVAPRPEASGPTGAIERVPSLGRWSRVRPRRCRPGLVTGVVWSWTPCRGSGGRKEWLHAVWAVVLALRRSGAEERDPTRRPGRGWRTRKVHGASRGIPKQTKEASPPWSEFEKCPLQRVREEHSQLGLYDRLMYEHN
ncbi:hypothetical protein NDU88_010878 [Pleurodeles waltl]|uniref:Uncharacterized protein n=1 Tax=Pleurodeles waltl TaxID=8319 RepID=A0AAV7QZF6_PLEWA|nr:hypothetical protein NDU88_010878 [Pleurodeles waltl]